MNPKHDKWQGGHKGGGLGNRSWQRQGGHGSGNRQVDSHTKPLAPPEGYIVAPAAAAVVWKGLLEKKQAARTLACTHYVPSRYSAETRDEDSQYKRKGVDSIVECLSESRFCKYWCAWVVQLQKDCPNRVSVVSATLLGRLLVNLSGGTLEHAGISLEYVCGVPVIPGSAVKGVARRYAIALLKETSGEEAAKLLADILAVFGYSLVDFEKDGDLYGYDAPSAQEGSMRAGQVDFLQAVPVENPALCCEVLTPHHKDYMSGKLATPCDTEKTDPSFFPAVDGAGDVRYAFTLFSPQDSRLLGVAEDWLKKGISLFGIGAKGSAGYGYFEI